VAVDMLPCCRRGAGVAGAARRDHDGYSDAPGRPVLPDGGTPPRLAHAEKNSETACSRVTNVQRVGPRDSSCPAPFSHSHKLTLASLKQALNPESSDFRLGRCRYPLKPYVLGVRELLGKETVQTAVCDRAHRNGLESIHRVVWCDDCHEFELINMNMR